MFIEKLIDISLNVIKNKSNINANDYIEQPDFVTYQRPWYVGPNLWVGQT